MIEDIEVVGSPLARFAAGMDEALAEAFQLLPGHGASLFQALGVTDPGSQISTTIEVDMVPPRRR